MKVTLKGYASLFNRPDLAGDEIAPGAFAKTLAARQDAVAMLYQHDATRPIGHWTRLQETPHGLWVEGELAAGVQLAQEVAALIEQDMLRGLSIGFRARRSTRGNGTTRRHLHDIDLVEISLVTFPMQPLARLQGPRGQGAPRQASCDERQIAEANPNPKSLTPAGERLRQLMLS